MTATSSGRTGGGEQQKARAVRGLVHPMGGGPTASDREGRSAAAAAGGVRVFEGEPGLLEVALVVQGDAVQVLGAEPVDEAAHAGALDHDVVVGWLVFDAEAVLEARAPPREHADPQPRGLGGDLLLRHELAHLDRGLVGQGQRDGGTPLRRRHCDPPVTCELRKSRRPCQLSLREARAPMRLTLADWLVVALYFLFNIAVGLYYKRRAGTSTAEYFLSGRNVPWWLAGTSMVATTFAADTPLVVTGLVAQNGVAGNWLWWNLLASGMLTVFFYARLWRRSGVMTDIEFAEIRYAGPPAAFLRGFRALYLGLLMNCIILGWVNLAMAKILELVFGISKGEALWIVVGLIVLTSAISTLSGLWGVLVTDLFQFVIKMGMVIVLAVVAVNAVGGIEAMKAKLVAAGRGSALGFVPEIGSVWMPMVTFFVYIAVNWWATWYPGAEPGGGGYVAQRMLSAKDERHSLLATLWFNIAHYAVRPWPWILVALASLILFPGLKDPETGYIRVMIDYLPSSLRGGGLPHRVDRRRLEAVDHHGRRDGCRAAVALVLVAYQRLERGVGDDHGLRRLGVVADRRRARQRPAARFRAHRARHGGCHDRALARRDLRDAPRDGRDAGRLLPPHPTVAPRLGARRGAGSGRPPVDRWPRQPGRLGRGVRARVRGAVRRGQAAVARPTARHPHARPQRHRRCGDLPRPVAARVAHRRRVSP